MRLGSFFFFFSRGEAGKQTTVLSNIGGGGGDCVTLTILTFVTTRTKRRGTKKPSKINKGRAADSHLKATAGLPLRNNGGNYTASVEL